jgi:hypothetical protein
MPLEAITAAGPAGLHTYDDIYPDELSEAARDRGMAALVELEVPEATAPVVEVEERVYLRRFAPGAAVTDDVSEAPPPVDDDETRLLQALMTAGAAGLTTAEIDGIVSDAAPLIGRLLSLGRVVSRGGRYYLAEFAQAELAQRIRAYAAKHPRDTDSIIAQALGCSAAEVHAALADAASPI